MKGKTVKKILSNTEKGYDLIADKFSSTRTFMWRDLEFVEDYVKFNDKVLDFGCGNGRLAGFLDDKRNEPAFAKASAGEYVGVDISQNLIDIANKKYSNGKTKFIKLNSQFKKLPFKDNYFDAVFSIAVFHHFPSKDYTRKVIDELYGVLKPGGKIVVTVWNLWQEQFLEYHKKSKVSWLEAKIPFKSGEKIFYRYHHPFKIGELESLFFKVGFKTLGKKENRNLLYIGEKSVIGKGYLTGKSK